MGLLGKLIPGKKKGDNQTPFYKTVQPDKVLGRCPNCGTRRHIWEKEFPNVYACVECGSQGPHPLFGVKV